MEKRVILLSVALYCAFAFSAQFISDVAVKGLIKNGFIERDYYSVSNRAMGALQVGDKIALSSVTNSNGVILGIGNSLSDYGITNKTSQTAVTLGQIKNDAGKTLGSNNSLSDYGITNIFTISASGDFSALTNSTEIWRFFPDDGYSISFGQLTGENYGWFLYKDGSEVEEMMGEESDEMVTFPNSNVTARKYKLNVITRSVAVDNSSIHNDNGVLELYGIRNSSGTLDDPRVPTEQDGGLVWSKISQMLDSKYFQMKNGKISLKDDIPLGGFGGAWKYNPQNRLFDNAYIQVAREIIDVAPQIVHTDITDGVWSLVIFHDPNKPLEFRMKKQGEYMDFGTREYSQFYIGTILNNKQTSGIYSMPILWIWE